MEESKEGCISALYNEQATQILKIFDGLLIKVGSCMTVLAGLQKEDASTGASALLSASADLFQLLITELKGFTNTLPESTRSLQALIFGGVVCPALDALVLLLKQKMPSLKKKKGGLSDSAKAVQ